eukprot:TRINITY_DN649_c0_g1_i1.p1 TRINITY_DN649_c0_g1~~TRINITY_DN649_c0_g1_i1.p1  ORF type:complete len:486 (-),score=165.40 TRINITY_DN649_c0_g1_i1:308-1765(-)
MSIASSTTASDPHTVKDASQEPPTELLSELSLGEAPLKDGKLSLSSATQEVEPKKVNTPNKPEEKGNVEKLDKEQSKEEKKLLKEEKKKLKQKELKEKKAQKEKEKEKEKEEKKKKKMKKIKKGTEDDIVDVETMDEDEESDVQEAKRLHVLKKTGRMFDPAMLLHEDADDHPECPGRLEAIMKMMKKTSLYDACVEIEAREATKEEVERVHSTDVRESIVKSSFLPKSDTIHFGPDTFANSYTSKAAHIAAGGLCELVKATVEGHIENGFAFIRPPGHHAEADKIMGFCLLNNAAIAARYAQEELGMKKILILDWDVHHGNGTEHIFEKDPSVLYMSVHKYGNFYPGTGANKDCGKEEGSGFNVNCGFSASGMGDRDYLALFKYLFVPIAKEFAPDFIIVSAGFDCAAGDKLGPMKVSTAGFAHMASLLESVAPGRIVFALEGGYTLDTTADCVEAVIRVLLGGTLPEIEEELPSAAATINILS